MDYIDLNKTYKVKTYTSTYSFNIGHSSVGYYINFKEHYNSVLFTEYSINKEKLSKEILGYYIQGMFPFCKTIEDCEKLLMALINKIKEKRDPSISTNFTFPNLESYWDD